MQTHPGQLERDPRHGQSAQPRIRAGRLPASTFATAAPTLITGDRPLLFAHDWILDNKLSSPGTSPSWIKRHRRPTSSSYRSCCRFAVEGDRSQRIASLGHRFYSPRRSSPITRRLMVAVEHRRPRHHGDLSHSTLRPRQFGEILAQHPQFDIGASVHVDGHTRSATSSPRPTPIVVLGFIGQCREAANRLDRREGSEVRRPRLTGRSPKLRNIFRRFPELVASTGGLLLHSDVSSGQGTFSSTKRRRRSKSCSPAEPWLTKDQLGRDAALRSQDARRLGDPRRTTSCLRNYKPGDKLPNGDSLHIHGGPMVRARQLGLAAPAPTLKSRSSRRAAMRSSCRLSRVTPGLRLQDLQGRFRHRRSANVG